MIIQQVCPTRRDHEILYRRPGDIGLGLPRLLSQFAHPIGNHCSYHYRNRSQHSSMVRPIRSVNNILHRRHSSHQGTFIPPAPAVRITMAWLKRTDLEQVKHDVKARLTLTSSGTSGGEGGRTHVQVLANSIVATVLVLLHARQLRARDKNGTGSQGCWPYGEDLLVVGIVSYESPASPPLLIARPRRVLKTIPQKLRGSSGRYVLLRTGHPLTQQASPHHVSDPARSPSRNKRRGHCDRDPCRLPRRFYHCPYFGGVVAVLRSRSDFDDGEASRREPAGL